MSKLKSQLLLALLFTGTLEAAILGIRVAGIANANVPPLAHLISTVFTFVFWFVMIRRRDNRRSETP